jgi:hypothetical protein
MLTRRIFGAVLFAGLIIIAAAAQDLTLDQILKKSEDALGGSDSISKVQTLKMAAKMVMGGGQMEMLMTVSTKRPHFVRVESVVQGKTIVAAYDGTTAWTINPLAGSSDPQKMDEKTAATLATSDIDEALGSLARLKAAGHTVELMGKEDAEGSPAYKIKITRKNGMTATHFLDAETFLPIKSINKVSQMGQEMEVEAYPGNYKKIGGILFPHSIEQKIGGRTFGQMIVEKIEINEPMDDTIFKMPAVEKPADKPAPKPPEKK